MVSLASQQFSRAQLEALTVMIATLLSSEQAEHVAALAGTGDDEFLAQIDALVEQDRQLPPEMPVPIPPSLNLPQHKRKEGTKKRALAGVEAVEIYERVIQVI